MIKRTVYFGNPAYLSLRNAQMVVKIPAEGESSTDTVNTMPIEDLAYVILDNGQITITQGLISALLDNNVAVIHCDTRHMPTGLVLPLSGNTLQSERFKNQIEASQPLKKQLWKQTVQTKIANQASNLNQLDIQTSNMERWITDVKSGDSTNLEARAAVFYWRNMFDDFTRERFGDSPNNILNYGYAILRAIIARSLVATGMLPTLGIHHHNRYNAYCLADDIMEPYRPVVDWMVHNIIKENGGGDIKLDTNIKKTLLSLPVIDVEIDGHRSPLMVAAATTAASLYKCFTGERRTILYPSMVYT